MTAISPLLTFPPVSWWQQAIKMDSIILDKAEHFEKMTSRNRYTIPGANNQVMLSVPLVNGRNQHVPMANVQIHNQERWQVQHWRTLVSVYRRSPYFSHYERALQPLFEQTYTHLADFNLAGLQWVLKELRLKIALEETSEFIKTYPEEVTDMRKGWQTETPLPQYYQVFEDRTGFVPDMSILDLMFSEGPFAVDKLR